METYVCPTHSSPLSLGVNHIRNSASTAIRLAISCILLETYQRHDTPPPLRILYHSFLFCMLTSAPWMFRPFLVNTFFTPSTQHFPFLPLLLTPLTSDSYNLLAIPKSPIPSTCPNHLSKP